jgi:hypothetical protein
VGGWGSGGSCNVATAIRSVDLPRTRRCDDVVDDVVDATEPIVHDIMATSLIAPRNNGLPSISTPPFQVLCTAWQKNERTLFKVLNYRIIWKIRRPAYSMGRCGRRGLRDGLGDGLGVRSSSDAGEMSERRHPRSPQMNNLPSQRQRKTSSRSPKLPTSQKFNFDTVR